MKNKYPLAVRICDRIHEPEICSSFGTFANFRGHLG